MAIEGEINVRITTSFMIGENAQPREEPVINVMKLIISPEHQHVKRSEESK